MTQQEITDALAISKNVILKNSAGEWIVPKTTIENVLGLQDELAKIADDVHLMSYKGTIGSAPELIRQTKAPGFVYIATADFFFYQNGKAETVEKGDMLVCDGTDYAVIQANINTNSLIHNGASHEHSFTDKLMIGTWAAGGAVSIKPIIAGSEGQVLTLNKDDENNIVPAWTGVENFTVKPVSSGSEIPDVAVPGNIYIAKSRFDFTNYTVTDGNRTEWPVIVDSGDIIIAQSENTGYITRGHFLIAKNSGLGIKNNNEISIFCGHGLLIDEHSHRLCADLSYEYTEDESEPQSEETDSEEPDEVNKI